jgi:hypothetical protein
MKKISQKKNFCFNFFFKFSYFYNSQSVPEPDEFNSIHFDREKFIESQQQISNSFNDINLFFPFFSLYYPAIMNTIHQKSFEIDEILDLSIPNKKQKRLSTNDDTI